MKIAILGKSGQLGGALVDSAPQDYELTVLGRSELDLTAPGQARELLDHLRPDVVINAAAYTAVDQAESEPELAQRINADAAGEIAATCKSIGARIIHISTDFVFDGSSGSPYNSDDDCNPRSVYGHSKLAGEQQIRASGAEHLILRTAWLYHDSGKNFLHTMLRLMKERDSISVVCDQTGTPTTCRSVASAIWRAVESPISGTYHCTDAGSASWYDFACAIYRFGSDNKLLSGQCAIKPIPCVDYPTPAQRPAFSVLNSQPLWHDLKITPVWWQTALKQTIENIGAAA